MGSNGEIRSLFFGIHLADTFMNPLKAADQAMDNFKDRAKGAGAAIGSFNDYLTANSKVLSVIGPELALIGNSMTNYFETGVMNAAKYKDAYSALYGDLGSQTDAFIEQMKEASGGMLTDAQIVQKANQARTMGIDLTYLPEMTRAARAAVRQFGGDMDYYYTSIISGTARQSREQLDNMGIIVRAEEANRAYAASIGKNVDALTDQEKKLAFQTAVFKAAKEMTDDVDWSQRSFNESIQEGRAALEEIQSVLSEGLIPILQPIVDLLLFVANGFEELPKPILYLIGVLGALFAIATLIIGALLTQSLLMSLLGGTSLSLGATTIVLTGTYVSFAGAVWAVVAAMGALLLETIWIWGPIALLIGALLVIQDLVDSGWEDSELKKFLDYLCDTFPYLTPLITAFEIVIWSLCDAIAYLSEKLKPLTDLLDSVNNNPVFKGLSSAYEFVNPTGNKVHAVQSAFDAYDTAVKDAQTGAAGGNNVSVTMQMGDVKTERMTKDEFEDMLRKNGVQIGELIEKILTLDIRSVL